MAPALAETGYIDAGVLYTLPEIRRRLGLGKHAIRTAKGKGLVVRKIGRRGYVLGKDVIAYVEATAIVER